MKCFGVVGFKVKYINCLFLIMIYIVLNLIILKDFGIIDGLIVFVEGSICYCFIFKLYCFKILM